MHPLRNWPLAAAVAATLAAAPPASPHSAHAQTPRPTQTPQTPRRAPRVDSSHYAALRWRMIGPHRGGRTKAAAGVPSRPNLFYVGVVNGGVWKTTDYGHTWKPIFDDQPTGSVGAIAVAPSNPDVIYVGSGEGLQRPDLSTGDGIYKSTDGGRTWAHLGLRDGQQIPQIVVDPRNPNRLFVAVLGHPYGPNDERGVFRSTDGGRTFQKVLYRDENTGAVDLVMDPRDANTLYAVLWESRHAPWENGVFTGPGSVVYKTTDGGNRWRPIMSGLPTFADDGLGRVGLAVAPSEPRRLFATVEATRGGGLYRSDDAGGSWRLVNGDTRVTSRASDFAEVKVHPTNPDVVFTGSIVAWKSTDGGRTFAAWKGAPGGDDYHRIWINPANPDVILLAADQGAVVTTNGGETWSSWYNQPTAQFYHVSTDNSFPYRVCGGQQESGSACVRSRGDHGQITFRDWTPVGVEEYGYVAPDPLDPDVLYGGKVTRFDRRTGQTQNVAPKPLRSADYRVLRTAPVLFSPLDPRALYFASNVVWRTTNGGASWTQISPDLTRKDSVVSPNVGAYADTPEATRRHPGVVYTVAPSYVSRDVIWAGTDDGLVHVTTNGGRTWTDVTPPDLAPWSKISLIDAGRFDARTAYVAVNTFRLDDLRPHIYRTHDGGRTWTRVTDGIPDGGVVNAVREDPVRRGLLYAGTERAVYVSFDDGARWHSLRQNMPATSIRDLVVKDDDLVVGTHGRSFWILDDVTPLRQLPDVGDLIDQGANVLFRPQRATRVRWNMNTDTPLPPEEPVGENPPDGAILHYWLKAPAGRVVVDVLDSTGTLVRQVTSDEPPEPLVPGRQIPDHWVRPAMRPGTDRGMHRFVWDLRWKTPDAPSFTYPIAAVTGNTPREPRGPWALPGRYTIRLTVDGAVQTQPLVVRMDPRVKTPPAALVRQHRLARQLADDMGRAAAAIRERRAAKEDASEIARLHGEVAALYATVLAADVAPTTQLEAAVAERHAALGRAFGGRATSRPGPALRR